MTVSAGGLLVNRGEALGPEIVIYREADEESLQECVRNGFVLRAGALASAGGGEPFGGNYDFGECRSDMRGGNCGFGVVFWHRN